MRSRIALWLTAGVLAAGALVVGCTYSPDFRNGSLMCSADGQCPRGYTCLSQRCCLPGDPTCGGTITIDASAGGNSGTHFDAGIDLPGIGRGGTTGGGGGQIGTGTGGTTVGRVQDYVGVWTFASSATVTTACDGTKSKSGVSTFDSGSKLTVTDNGDGTLLASWTEWPACTYLMAVDATGAHGTEPYTIASAWSCQFTSDDPMEFWVYDSFDIVATSATVGTHDGVYYREDDWADGTTVYCTQTVHAPMTKN